MNFANIYNKVNKVGKEMMVMKSTYMRKMDKKLWNPMRILFVLVNEEDIWCEVRAKIRRIIENKVGREVYKRAYKERSR